MTAFRAGVLTGIGLFACAASSIYLIVRDPAPLRHNFEASAVGADLTRHGARSVEIRTTYGPLMRQTCNGACDDLSYKIKIAGENGLSVLVRDAAGTCLSCEGGAYVDGASREAVVVQMDGVEKLKARGGYRRRQADGSTKLEMITEATPDIKP